MAYEATLSIVVAKDGEPYFKAELAYDDLDYRGVVITETAFKNMAAKLTEVGWQMAVEKGVFTVEEVDRMKAALG